MSPITGAVYAATFPKFLSFAMAAPTVADPQRPASPNHRSPVEIWRIGNETDPEQTFLGRQYTKEVALADPTGQTVTVVTAAVPWKNQLLLTGYFSPHAVVCEFDSEL